VDEVGLALSVCFAGTGAVVETVNLDVTEAVVVGTEADTFPAIRSAGGALCGTAGFAPVGFALIAGTLSSFLGTSVDLEIVASEGTVGAAAVGFEGAGMDLTSPGAAVDLALAGSLMSEVCVDGAAALDAAGAGAVEAVGGGLEVADDGSLLMGAFAGPTAVF